MERTRGARAWHFPRLLAVLVAVGGILAVGGAALALVRDGDGQPPPSSAASTEPTATSVTAATRAEMVELTAPDADASLPAERAGRRVAPVGGRDGQILLFSERDVWPGSGGTAPQVPVQTDQQFILWDPVTGDTRVAWTRTDSFREMVTGVQGDWVLSVPHRGLLMDWQVVLRNLDTGESRLIGSHDPRFAAAASWPALLPYQAAHWGDLAGDGLPVLGDGYATWVQTVIDQNERVRQHVVLYDIANDATSVVFDVSEPRQLDEHGNWTSGGHAWSAGVGGGTVAWVYQGSPDASPVVMVYDIGSGETEPVDLPQQPGGVAVSGSGETLAVTVEGDILLVELATGEIARANNAANLPAGHRVHFEGDYLWWRPPSPTPQQARVVDVGNGEAWVTATPTHDALVAGGWFAWQERGADGRPSFYHFVRLAD